MEIEIYADVLFIINFFMIFFIFWIVNKLIVNKSNLKNLLLGAFFGSLLYLIFIMFIPYKNYLKLLSTIVIMLFSIYISFKPKTLKSYVKLFFIVNLVSFTIAGVCFYLFYFNNTFYSIIQNISFKLLLVCIFICYIFIKISLKWYKKLFLKGQCFYEIVLYKNGKNVILNALLDTGNTLIEPITKKPVLVVEFLAIQKILTKSLNTYINNNENDLTYLLKDGLKNDIRFIPFKSIGKESGLMIGLKIDILEIKTEKNICIKDAIVAISNLKIAKDNSYNALLNPELLK